MLRRRQHPSRPAARAANLRVLLLIAAISAAAAPGAAGVRHFARDLAHARISGLEAVEGASIAVGDFNGDAVADVAVGQPYDVWGGPPYVARIHLWFGPIPATAGDEELPADVILEGSSGSVSVRGLRSGDFNGDGFDDLLLSVGYDCLQPLPPNAAWILFGRQGWLPRLSLPAAVDVDIRRQVRDALYPLTGGDLDGDGADEVFVELRPDCPAPCPPRHVAAFYGRRTWPARFDFLTTTSDLMITGLAGGMDVQVADAGGGRDLVLGATAIYRAPGRRTGVLDVATEPPDVELRGGENPDRAGVTRLADGRPVLAVTRGCDPELSGCRTPWRVELLDVGSDGVIDLAAPGARLVGTLPGARLLPVPVRPVLSDPELALPRLLVSSDELPRSRVASVHGGVAALPASVPASRIVDLRFGAGPWHLFDVGRRDLRDPVGLHEGSYLAAGDLTGDGHDDLVGWGGGAAGPVVLVVDLARAALPLRDPVLHVDPATGSDAADGTSWATALATLQAALERAEVAEGAVEIRVAEGTQELTSARTFREDQVIVSGQAFIGQGVSVLGGFASGGGTRDPARFVTRIEVRSPPVWLARVAVGPLVAAVADAPAILDGVHVRSVLMRGPAVLSGSRVSGSAVHVTETWTCPGWGGECTPELGGFPHALGVGVKVERGPAWIWNDLVEGHSAQVFANCMSWDPMGPWCAPPRVPLGGGIVSLAPGSVMALTTVTSNVSSDDVVGRLAWSSGSVTVRDSIVAGNHAWPDLRLLPADVASRVLHASSEPALPAGNPRLPPDFADAQYRLAQPAAGQESLSPAVDAGGMAASSACHPHGLGCASGLSTRTDGAPDAAVVDLGFHWHVARDEWISASLEASGGECAVRLEWEPAPWAAEYRIYRGAPGGVPITAPVAVVPAPAAGWSDADAGASVTHAYRVEAADAFERILHPVEVAAAAIDTRPPHVSGASATTAACTATIAAVVADDCTGAEAGVDVHRGTRPDFVPDATTLVAAGVALPHADVLPANGIWHYRIVARDHAGNVAISSPIDARAAACAGAVPPPGRVTGLRAWKDGGSLALSFIPAPGADFHRMLTCDRSGLPGGFGFVAGPGPDGRSGTSDDLGLCDVEAAGARDPAALSRPGAAFFVVRGIAASGEGSAGLDSALRERSPPPDACP